MSRRVPPRGSFNGESPFGRLPTEPSFPTIRVSRRGVIWIVVAALVRLILFLLKPFAPLYTDYPWCPALGYGGVFGTRFAAQLWSFFIFAIVFWVIGGVNVLLALNSGRRLSSIGIRQRLLTAPSTILAMLAVFLLGLLFGQIASGQWQTILTYLNQKPFNVQDPIWHKDVGYYVFTLPFYRFLWGWFLGVVVLMALIAIGLLANAAVGRLTPLPVALVAWLGAAFILLVIFPGVIQRFQVAPSELSRETPYIKNMIDFTRQAYGLTSIADRPFTPKDALTADAVARNPQTVQNARLWDPQLALPYT